MSLTLLLLPSPARANLGLELAGSFQQFQGGDPAKLRDSWAAPAPGDTGQRTVKLTDASLGGGVHLFLEGERPWRMGLSLGFEVLTGPDLKSDYSNPAAGFASATKIDNVTYDVPLTMYLKWKPEGQRYGVRLGTGADYLMVQTRISSNYTGGFLNAKVSGRAVAPHVKLGGEFYLTERISVGLDVKYILMGKMKDLSGDCSDSTGNSFRCQMVMVPDGAGETLDLQDVSKPPAPGSRPFQYDFSGPRAFLGARFYF